ncbi:unnamed protein product [Paramecium sonneborni]|uniref:Uncharacterized protein n=1 Tax=Paramecium sonneborni TaxID=65129 RepID=A0A8S1RLD8_9CILI|nr:unnamed protein product [Paramecium sonneborni]CAD8127961.1 unnamed protein product [Paramecium sonneborni]
MLNENIALDSKVERGIDALISKLYSSGSNRFEMVVKQNNSELKIILEFICNKTSFKQKQFIELIIKEYYQSNKSSKENKIKDYQSVQNYYNFTYHI